MCIVSATLPQSDATSSTHLIVMQENSTTGSETPETGGDPWQALNSAAGLRNSAADSQQDTLAGAGESAVLDELLELKIAVGQGNGTSNQIYDSLSQQNISILGIARVLAEVRDAIEDLKPVAAAQGGSIAESTLARLSQSMGDAGSAGPAANDTEPHSESAPEPEAKFDNGTVGNNEWHQIRDAFLSQTQDEASEQTSQVPLDAESHGPAEGISAGGESELPEPPAQPKEDEVSLDDLLASLPTPIAPDCADVEALQEALAERDRVLFTMARRLHQRLRSRPALSPDQLEQLRDAMPEELAAQVNTGLEAMHQQVRLGELELSLERARVSRQLSNLAETRERLESNARIFGMNISEDGTIESSSAPVELNDTKSRRWLAVLGFGDK